MVLTSDIQTAILYYFAINQKLKDYGNPFKTIVAFSGKKKVKGIEYTESEINGFASKDISAKFDTDEYRLLIVANKFLTGFDQIKLSAMYVDKKLQDVLAVQALSRLNRSANNLGKRTEDLFILDFFNKVEDIKTSFEPFYTATSLNKSTDINVLHELKEFLDDIGVYNKEEVEKFVEKYFNGADASELSPIIDTSAQRFNNDLDIKDEEKIDYKIKAKQFVKIYGQMASIMPYEIIDWEKLFWFLKFLIPKLIIQDKNQDVLDELLNSIDLSTYGLERVRLNSSIQLDDEETKLEPQNPNPRGAYGMEDEKDPLDIIINSFNERWFQGWDNTPEEQKVRILKTARKVTEHIDFESKYVNNLDSHTRHLAYVSIFDEVMNEQRQSELELYKMISQDDTFKAAYRDTVQRFLKI